jgi:DNA (cytosine-5)-methyltransferase 1
MALRLLETHGCQGIGHAGYVRSGWDVDAVDINANHAKYHPGELIIADAATYIREHGHKYDARHTSPPCQWYTRGNAPRRGEVSKWERSIPPIREALEDCGGPYVIENVKDAVWDLRDPVMLCGCMFGLSTIDTDGIRIHLERPRLFELGGWDIPGMIEQTITVKGEVYAVRSPQPCDHTAHEWTAGAYGGARRDKYEARYIRKGGYVPPQKATVMALLGITPDDRAGAQKPEPTWDGLFECLPPAYTEFMGRHLLDHLVAVAA